MALEGKLLADFENFYTAVDKASVKFRSLDSGGALVEKRLNAIADSFSGRKVVQEATLVSEAIERIGGTSKLSTSEAALGLRTLDQAMEKMLRTGQEIPTSMMKQAAELRNVTRVTDLADQSVLRITGTYHKFDGILQSLGINIGPYVKGLEDVVAIATTGAPALGALGTAAAAVAAALGGWKIGTVIGETYGLTDAIAKGWAALLKYGDVQQQVALAQADAADLAGKAAENERLRTTTVEAATKAQKEETDALRENWRITEGNKNALERLAEQIEANKEKKHADAIASFKASQAQSIFGEETEKTTSKIEAQTTALEEREKSIKKIEEAEAARKKKEDEFMNAPTLNDRKAQSVTTDLRDLTGFALDNVISRFRQAGDQSESQALNRALATLEGEEGRRRAPTNNREFFALQRDQVLLTQLRNLQSSGRIPGFGGGESVTVTNNITVEAGLGDRYTIAQAVKEALVDDHNSFGYRVPVPFGAS